MPISGGYVTSFLRRHRSTGWRPSATRCCGSFSQDRTRHLLAVDDGVDDGAVSGYLTCTPAGDDDSPAMAEVVVHPHARRRGFGATMIRTALREAGRDPDLGARQSGAGTRHRVRTRSGAGP